jgi:Secretion system C-terminal sorting domain
MKKLLLVFTTFFLSHLIFAQAFTEGNLVIYRVGDGVSSLANTGNPVFLDEYTPTGTLVQSKALPTTVSGANKQCIASGTASSEGLITRSENGRYLTFTGYARDLGGVGNVTATTSAVVGRTIGVVGNDGIINTSTSLSDFASANNIRSAVTDNGSQFWVAGAAAALSPGTAYATLAATTSTPISTTLSNIRQINIFGGQLFVSTSVLGSTRINTVGTGLPTTSGQAITGLPTFPTLGSMFSFVLFDMDVVTPGYDVIYVVGDDAIALTKYSLVAGTWVSNGVVGVATDTYRGLTARLTGSTVTLYATRKGGTAAAGGGEFVSLVDASGYNGAFSAVPSVIVTAGVSKAFRGIAFAPIVPPLPIKFVSFKASTKNNEVVLNFTTTNEQDIAMLTIQKSNDGIYFEDVKNINPTNSGALQQYQYNYGANNNSANIFFRVKSTENNGVMEYSTIVKVEPTTKVNLIKVYPSIASNNITIDFTSGTSTGEIIISNAVGLKVDQMNILTNTTSKTFDLTKLKAGIYYIKYSAKNGLQQTVQFIKQ